MCVSVSLVVRDHILALRNQLLYVFQISENTLLPVERRLEGVFSPSSRHRM
jgi:hypothetical protein